MLRILSDQESEQWKKELDEFLLGLDWNTKEYIKRLLENHVKTQKLTGYTELFDGVFY